MSRRIAEMKRSIVSANYGVGEERKELRGRQRSAVEMEADMRINRDEAREVDQMEMQILVRIK